MEHKLRFMVTETNGHKWYCNCNKVFKSSHELGLHMDHETTKSAWECDYIKKINKKMELMNKAELHKLLENIETRTEK